MSLVWVQYLKIKAKCLKSVTSNVFVYFYKMLLPAKKAVDYL